MTDGFPVSIEWMIDAAYSFDLASGMASPRSSIPLTRSYSRRFSSLRRMYSSTGMRCRSISSSCDMNHGTYSAACSLDSVGK